MECRNSVGATERLISTGRKRPGGFTLTLSWSCRHVLGSVWSLARRSGDSVWSTTQGCLVVREPEGKNQLSSRNVWGSQPLIISKRGLMREPHRESLWPRCLCPRTEYGQSLLIYQVPLRILLYLRSHLPKHTLDWQIHCSLQMEITLVRAQSGAFPPKNTLSLKTHLHVLDLLH